MTQDVLCDAVAARGVLQYELRRQMAEQVRVDLEAGSLPDETGNPGAEIVRCQMATGR